ncbi:MAG: response regulator transcription factor [Candidatus Promineifilaceae bacterium]|nr:response regulator transcription factor [Candidatus Promineifilaceae bacterium]
MIRILLVDVEPQSVRPFAQFLQEQPDMHLSGNANSIAQALYQLQYCDVVILNTMSAGTGWLPLVRQIAAQRQSPPPLVLLEQEEPGLIMRYVEAGARGYLLREEPPQRLLRKIRAARQQRAIVSPLVGGKLISRLAELRSAAQKHGAADGRVGRFEELTSREREVLVLINDGNTNAQIAEELTITEGTVKNHVHRILRKLHVESRYQAAAVYRQWQMERRAWLQAERGANAVTAPPAHTGAGAPAASFVAHKP